MVESVPIRSTFLLALPPPPVHAPAKSAMESPRAIVRPCRRLISASSRRSRCERRLVDRQYAPVGVDGCRDAERNGREVLAVAERKVEQHGNPERREMLLEHVLHR